MASNDGEEDDLNDLFGAFDGEEEEKKEEKKEERKDARKKIHKKSSNATANAPANAQSNAEDSMEVDPADKDEGFMDDENIMMSASDILSHPLLLSMKVLALETKPLSAAVEETTSKGDSSREAGSSEQEIATGTSHDKSIRTYTAHPRHERDRDAPPGNGSSEPAKTYPFELDPFQTTAISYLERNDSVLVAAHTSAGKTVVAEYAIALALRNKQRVIYTSPIKALSNQKYRDLSEDFGEDNVGLMTGDTTINPSAFCLVMTTEILRSMLYRGSEIVREVAWVVYDEVHYMRDAERGVVWEESIVLLPHTVRFVFLSATIPNAEQFVEWICKIHLQTCHVVYTNYRPVPLQHYVFPADGEGLHLVVDEQGKFREKNFEKAMSALQKTGMDGAIAESMAGSGSKKRKKPLQGKKGMASDLYRIVKLIMARSLNPVIVFSFSKKRLRALCS